MIKTKTPRVALLFSQFSAYHIDRCEAVSRRLEGRYDVIAVEVATRSEAYAWGPSGEVAGAHKVTLFPGESYDKIAWPRRLLAQLRVLWRCRAVFVGIGYNERDIVLLSWLLRLIGVQVIAMSESKFDDYQRGVGLELLKAMLLSAYNGAIVGGQRQSSYFRFLGFRRRKVLPGYDTVGLDRVRAMGGSALAPGGAAFRDRPFVYVGRFVDKKNLAALVDGFAIYAAAAGKSARRLILVGAGPEEPAVRARIGEHCLDELVELPGFLDAEAVAQTMAGALALVLPSRVEQWGLVVNEALAFGLPAVVSNEVGARDALVRSGVNGFVVESDSAEGLAAAMTALAGDKTLWLKMVAASHRRAWMGDTERLADAVEAMLDPAAEQAAARIAAFQQELPLPSGEHGQPLAVRLQPTVAALATKQRSGITNYWNGYYSGKGVPVAPSEFARFALRQIAHCPNVIDVGCGNGRDSMFMLEQGKIVRAIDESSEAIAACARQAKSAGYSSQAARFVVGDVGEPASWQDLSEGLDGPVAVYARFLFHAIDDDTEGRLLDRICALVSARDGVLCAEFRTPADAALSKVAPAHYRRYVDPDRFCARLAERGLSVIYRREGQGMARFKSEDAHVVRIVATPAIDFVDGKPTPGLVRLQAIEKQIAIRFFDYCKANGLATFLVCGSALGAVRHGDTIPWDDDIDLGMLRADYQRLFDLWQHEPIRGLYLQSHHSEPGYLYPFAKLRLDGSYVHVPQHLGECRHTGVAIDIFPFDALPTSAMLRWLQVNMLGLFNLFIFPSSKAGLATTKPVPLRWARQFARVLRPAMPLRLLLVWRDSWSRLGWSSKSTQADSFGMYGIRFGPRTEVATDVLVPPVTARFGEIEALVPRDCETYLTGLFGDYRELPPEAARRPGHVLAASGSASISGQAE